MNSARHGDEFEIQHHDYCFTPGRVEVSQIGDFRCGPQTIISHEAMDFLAIIYVTEGKLEVRLSDSGEFVLSTNELLVIFPGRILSARTHARKNRVMSVSLRGSQAVASVLRLGYWDLMRSEEPYQGDLLSCIIRRFRESPDAGRDLQMLRMVEHLLVTVWQRVRNNSGKAGFYDVLKVLNALPFDRFTTDAAAETLGISRTKLNDIMVSNGVGRPGRYLARNRFFVAQAMLYFSHESIERIAEHLGFSSASAFGLFFRKQCGRTPGEFRKRAIPC